MSSFVETADQIGKLVTEKNKAYGNSFVQSAKVLEVLYPKGVSPEQYIDMLAVVRIVNKLFRIANSKDAFDENPYNDIAGYGVLLATHFNNNADKALEPQHTSYKDLNFEPDWT